VLLNMADPGQIETELGVPIPGVILPPEQWARTALKKLPQEGPLDWESLFGRRAPIVLDLGCGNGRFTIASALRRPEMDHLGLDILPVVIRYATRRANQRGLSSVRFAVGGAAEFLDKLVAPHTIAEIHGYHPQPYGDAQKIGRRLLTPGFFALVHRSLVPGGLFVIQTDNPAYWRYIAAVAPRFFELHEQKGPWPDAPEGRSRREIMARRMGLEVFRAWGHPLPELGDKARQALVAELPVPDFDAAIKRRRPGWHGFTRRSRG
jgi:tRNA (guanine-N7-)-methyltransferase